MTEPILPIDESRGPAPVEQLRLLTPREREEQREAREQARRRKRRSAQAQPKPGRGGLDVRG